MKPKARYPYLYELVAFVMKISNNKAKRLIKQGGVHLLTYEKNKNI